MTGFFSSIGMGAAAIAGGAIIGGLISANGATSAANTQANAANNQIAAQQQALTEQQKIAQPWVTSGTAALQSLQAGLAPGGNLNPPAYTPLNASTFQQTPQSQYLQQQSMLASQNQASATGQNLTGGELQALQANASGLAAQDYNTAFAQNLQNYNTQAGGTQQQVSNLQNLS